MALYRKNNDILDNLEIIENNIDIPIVENTRLNNNIVRINNLIDFNESNGYTIKEGIEKLKDTNQIDSLIISVDEATLIENPWLSNINNIIISKVSEESELDDITSFVLTEYFVNKNEGILDIFLETKDMNELQTIFVEDISIIDNIKSGINDTVNKTKEMVQKGITKGKELTNQAMEQGSKLATDIKNKGTETFDKAKEFASNNSNTMIAGGGGALAGGLLGYMAGKNSGTNQSQPNQTVNKPGFFAQKLAAIKRWLNQNLGTNFDISESYLEDIINKITINEVYRPRRKYHVRYTY